MGSNLLANTGARDTRSSGHSQTFAKEYNSKPLRPPRRFETDPVPPDGRLGHPGRHVTPGYPMRSISESSGDHAGCCPMIAHASTGTNCMHTSESQIPILTDHDSFQPEIDIFHPRESKPTTICSCHNNRTGHPCRRLQNNLNQGITKNQQQRGEKQYGFTRHSNSMSQLDRLQLENPSSDGDFYEEVPLSKHRRSARRCSWTQLAVGLSLILSLAVSIGLGLIIHFKTTGTYCISKDEYTQLFGSSMLDEGDEKCFSSMVEFIMETRKIVKQEVALQTGSDNSLKRHILEALNLSQLSLSKPGTHLKIAQDQERDPSTIKWKQPGRGYIQNLRLSPNGAELLVTTPGYYHVHCQLYYYNNNYNDNSDTPVVKLMVRRKSGGHVERIDVSRGINPTLLATVRLFQKDTVTVTTTNKSVLDTHAEGASFGMFLI